MSAARAGALRIPTLVGLGLLTTLLLPLDVASAQAGGPMDLRLNAYGSLRGGGEWSFDDDTLTVSDGLRAGGGFGLRVEVPVGEYVAIGPLLEFNSIGLRDRTPGDAVPDRYAALTFGLWIKGRYIVDAAGYPLELYLGMPFGLTVYLPNADDWDNEVGISVGLMGGGQFFVTERVGLLLEMGFRRDGFRTDGVFSDKAKVKAIQFALNAGISLAF